MDSNYMTTSEPGGTATDKTIGRCNNSKQDAAYHQATERGSNGSASRLRWILNRLEVPEEVVLFEQFEELSKLYAIEAPFVARSQVELVFDVFDGRKLRQLGLTEEEEEEDDGEGDIGQNDIEQMDEGGGLRSSTFDRLAKSTTHHLIHTKSTSKRHNFTWSRWLSFKRSNQQRQKHHRSGMGIPMKCCMSKSDTSNEFALSTSSSGAIRATSASENDTGDDYDPELKEEAQRMIGPILSQLRRRSSLLAQLASEQQLLPASNCLEQQQQQVILEGCGAGLGVGGGQESSQISVCLFDKRGRLAKLKREAENGRRRAQVEARLDELARCQRGATGSGSASAARVAEAQVERVVRKRLGHLDSSRAYTEAEQLSCGQLEQLIDLTKNSLNHLIDAQLLLRNKLTSEQEQLQLGQQQQQSRIGISMEYDALLKNNFNLLKVWQNLEETKRLVCFVCEPIKSNLSDLFWFSRQRLAREISCKLASPGDLLLVSPLVSLDGIQVKRGLLQILEALNYLHSICKLIHRNLTPQNILVAANGNWKLSGLEFAIRFESATISQSASIMAQEGCGSLLLRCASSSSSGARANFCRQRTLHQTKCDEFIRRPKNGVRIIQPEVDYLAPEIWRSAKCSHKSDMFSYGLILGQTYDLCRHKPPISCGRAASAATVQGGSQAAGYDLELKKLHERRKRKLGRLVPFEMRSTLLEMLDIEPNARPSANHALQLFKRPIELCKVNEDTLRHLRSSLGYLETRLLNNNNSIVSSCINNNNNNNSGNINNTTHKKRINYFRKVTSAMMDQPAARRAGQTRSLHLLNLLLRGVDSLANTNIVGMAAEFAPDQHPQLIFNQLKQQFELTFESLRQLYDDPSGTTAAHGAIATANSDTLICPDSRSLMLVIALHRRLLEQVAQMRSELPPVSRLVGPTAQTNRLAQSHRSLAEMEDRLHCLISRHSVGKLVPILTDPMLKLEEFLLVFELVNDLLAFLGQKCRQNFTQRGKQLLNDLTPVTGCPSLSSSDEDYEDEDSAQGDSCQAATARPLMNSRNLVGAGSRQTLGSRETLNNFCITNNNNTININTNSNTGGIKNRMSHRFSEYDDSTAAAARQVGQSRHFQFQNQSNLASTKISITAPSPMGSMRDINNSRMLPAGANETNLNYDQIQARMQHHQSQAQQESEMIERTGQLSMSCAISYSGPDGELVDHTGQGDESQQQQRFCFNTVGGGGSGGSGGSSSDGNEPPVGADKEGSKTRSQLIDELLKTINDDSFNDLVDFNNKYAGSQQQQQQQQQLTPSQLANLNRPRSAMDSSQQQQQRGSSGGSRSQGPSSASGGGGGQQQQPAGSSARPNSLALGNNQQPTRVGGTSPSTFDNVIRRMSTNIVQNFNKMSNNNNNSSNDMQQQQQQQEASYANALRREKSSNAPNSLYVDNQVPVRRHSDNTINVPRIQVALSSPQATKAAGMGGNQRASVSATKLANKWKLSTVTNRKESNDRLSPNLSGALGYMRRHSSGNTTGNDQSQSNGQTSNLLFNTSPFKTKSSTNLGIDFLISNRSMKRRCSAASMLGHQTQRKAEDLIDAGMKSVQNMFG